MISFSENVILYDDQQNNVETPPESLMQNGFIPAGPNRRGQPLVANWLNWLFREAFRKINRNRVSDGTGAGLLSSQDSDTIIVLYAIQKTDTTKFLHAIAYKSGNTAPNWKTLSNSGLTLGTTTATDVPIAGAAAGDIIQYITVMKA